MCAFLKLPPSIFYCDLLCTECVHPNRTHAQTYSIYTFLEGAFTLLVYCIFHGMYSIFTPLPFLAEHESFYLGTREVEGSMKGKQLIHNKKDKNSSSCSLCP